ncbi:MAG: single-stranded-DNA-specific exonuclease RecJ [Chloroflexota bacterium]|nr:MAG: single-stranded-DNA-specific exonuclease RecJ [Chloroflexota bacterium]
MKCWIEPTPVEPPESLLAAAGGNPLVAQTLFRRGMGSPEAARAFLDPGAYSPAPPTDLPDLAIACGRIRQAIGSKERVCVWGDFDVDGQTSTTLLVSTLRDLGAEVSYHIPVREAESHGVNISILQQVIDQGASLVITCDTGITAHASVDYAQSRKVPVIVTDHHDLSGTLPNAHAVVNPKRLLSDPSTASHPLLHLPGVGVAYKLAEALYSLFGRPGEEQKYLDLVALGIVADVALLSGDVRYLLQRGLQSLRNTPRLGLLAMFEWAEIDPACLTEDHIAYSLAPRLNAIGRLADANPVVEMLSTQDNSRAKVLALQLETLNARRKLLTSQVFQGALSQIERDPSLLDDPVLVLSNPAWPAGVIGIVASRLVERFHRPAVLISSPPGELSRGSARSIDRVNITAAIAAHTELLSGFGGHPMAAGLAIDPERIFDFRRALSKTVLAMAGPASPAELALDGYLPIAGLSLELVADLERLAPFGAGNLPLALASRYMLCKSHSTLGRGEEHLILNLEDEQGVSQRVVWWGGATEIQAAALPQGRFDLAYSVRSTTFGGQRGVQVEWLDYRQVEEQAVEILDRRPTIQMIDHRQAAHPLPLLKALLDRPEIQVWGEADARQKISARSRYELTPTETLAIWTIPPGPRELRQALDRVSPLTVYLFAVDPQTDDMQSFLKRLSGLVKYTLAARGGCVRLSELAAGMAHREATIRKGLEWLQASSPICTIRMDGDEIELGQGDSRGSGQTAQEEIQASKALTQQLKAMLEETAAYRRQYCRADPEMLICPPETPKKKR